MSARKSTNKSIFVSSTCLDEIERSRPFFLGLIGDRYGWTPPRHDMKAALKAARFSLNDLNKSVTALEIEYGVLRSKNPPICLFYFRESPDYSGLPEEMCQIYRDEAKGLEKLAKLKEEIRARFKPDIKTYTTEVREKGLSDLRKRQADSMAAEAKANGEELTVDTALSEADTVCYDFDVMYRLFDNLRDSGYYIDKYNGGGK